MIDVTSKVRQFDFVSKKTVKKKICLGVELAHALAAIKLSEKEAAAWNRDLKKARRSLKPPSNKWQ
ncbi:MAG TPA: hypothetical protein VGO67_19230 [Verrucomicrobiae bacterium]